MLGAFLLAAVPAQAGPVEYRDVVSLSSALGRSGQPSVDLRLRSIAQQQGKNSTQTAPLPGAGAQQDAKTGGPSGGDAAAAAAGTGDPLTGAQEAPQQQQTTTVETIELGEVDGTLCDCGTIKIPGGFPLWPLLGLGGVPLLFLPDDEERTDVTPTPTPTPTPSEIPEPATLLLFGSGLAALGAGARRRRARQSKLQQATGEV